MTLSDWVAFLAEHGFDTAQQRPTFDPTNNVPIGAQLTALVDLSHLGAISVSGDDAPGFLQGQLSNDIKALSDQNPHQLSAWCNPKGRMVAFFHVLKDSDSYVLIAPRSIIEHILPRFKLFVMRAKVTVEYLPDTGVLGIIGTDVVSDLPRYALSDSYNRAFIVASYTALKALWQKIEADQYRDGRTWEGIDCHLGWPQVTAATSEAFIPQMVNLDLCNGVNFKKGCYPGQEIVARIHYRGKPKSRMILVSSPHAASVGDPVFIDGRDQTAGQVVTEVSKANGSSTLLVTVPLSHISSGKLYLTPNSEPLERCVLPYSIPEALPPSG